MALRNGVPWVYFKPPEISIDGVRVRVKSGIMPSGRFWPTALKDGKANSGGRPPNRQWDGAGFHDPSEEMPGCSQRTLNPIGFDGRVTPRSPRHGRSRRRHFCDGSVNSLIKLDISRTWPRGPWPWAPAIFRRNPAGPGHANDADVQFDMDRTPPEPRMERRMGDREGESTPESMGFIALDLSSFSFLGTVFWATV